MNWTERELRDALGVHVMCPSHKWAFSLWHQISQSKAKPSQIHVLWRRSGGPQHQLIQSHWCVYTALLAKKDIT